MRIIITIDRFEGEKTVLKTDDGDTIIWPKNKLPKEAREGSVLNFIISKDVETEDEKRELAKNILNELLEAKESS